MQPSQTHPNGYLVVACCRFSPKTILRILYGKKCLGFCVTKACADWNLRHSLLLLSSPLSVVRSYLFWDNHKSPGLPSTSPPYATLKGQHQNNCGFWTNHFARFGILASNCASAAWEEQSYSIGYEMYRWARTQAFFWLGIPLKNNRLKHPRINHQADRLIFIYCRKFRFKNKMFTPEMFHSLQLT